jgi:hypothetical protein
VRNKEYLRHTRTILQEPAMGHVDGTAAVVGDRGFLFLFNPNYKQLPADFVLDQSIGVTEGKQYLLKEIYPFTGRLLGKERSGISTRGDIVHTMLDGTSATVFEIIPVTQIDHPLVFNAASLSEQAAAKAELKGTDLILTHVAGQPGTT